MVRPVVRVVRGSFTKRAIRGLIDSSDTGVDRCGCRIAAHRARWRVDPRLPVDYRLLVRSRGARCFLWPRPARSSHHVGERAATCVLLLGRRLASQGRADSGLSRQQEPSCVCCALVGSVPDPAIHADTFGAPVDGALAGGVRCRPVVDSVRDSRSLDGRLLPGHRGPGCPAPRSGASASTRRWHVRRDRRSYRDRSVLLSPHDRRRFRSQP